MTTGAMLRVAIEQENIHGTLLLVTSDQPRLMRSNVSKAGVIRPSDVEHWIREARAAGWQAAQPGPVFHYTGEAICKRHPAL